MPHTVIKEQVDIYQLPEVCYVANENTQVTIGDLHGNAMKLLFMLIKQGIASNVSKENYKILVEIYSKTADELKISDILAFNWILSDMQFNTAMVRLIGDEFADRGSNDYFTLKILQRLQEQQIPVEILVSNHGIEFLEACDKYKISKHFHAPMLKPVHAGSLDGLNTLVNKGYVSAEEVLDIVQKAYKPNLKAISYSLNDDHSEITIYSHAGVGLNTIKGLAEQFEVPYRDSTASALAKTIDRINVKFREQVQQGTVPSLCPVSAMDAAYGGYADLTKTPLVCALWNRRYDLITRPTYYNGYRLIFVHGHDESDPAQGKPNFYNLDEDNNLGKAVSLNVGTYTVLNTDNNRKEPIEYVDIAPLELKIKNELARLKTSKSSMDSFLVNIGLIEASDTKYRAYKGLREKLQSGEIGGNREAEFYEELWQWKKDNKSELAKHRDLIYKFFSSDQKTKSLSVADNIFAELGFIE